MRARVAVLAVVASLLAGVTSAEDGIPDLTGKWTGTYTGGVRQGGELVAPSLKPTLVKPGDRELTLTISTQQGRGLIGLVASGAKSQPIHGVIRMDNKTVLFTDKDSVNSATLMSPNEMELCHQTTDRREMSAFCFVLKRP